MAVGKTLVIQSQSAAANAGWLQTCLSTVKSWAAESDMDYMFLGDELFELLPDDIREKTQGQPIIGTDLARLLALRIGLGEGYQAVVWCDADFLVFDSPALILPPSLYALGREVWIQGDPHHPTAHVKVHNAFLMFRRDNPFLTFYIHACEQMIREHQGPMAPQFIGPKFLTVIHNMLTCPVVERAGVLSPLVLRDLLMGGGASLDLFKRRSSEPPAGLNLCRSLVAGGELDELALSEVVNKLLTGGL